MDNDEEIADSVPSAGSPSTPAAQLVMSNLANTCSLSLNKHHRLVICLQEECQYAIRPDQIEKHLRRHGIQLERGQAAGLAQACGATKIPLLPAKNAVQIPGIPLIVDGFGCDTCSFACINEAWANRHHCTDNSSTFRATVQSPLRNKLRYFVCTPWASQGSEATAATICAQELAKHTALLAQSPAAVLTDISFETSDAFKKKYGLSQFVLHRTEPELASLSALTAIPAPGDDLFGQLRLACDCYMRTSREHLDDISTWTIRKNLRSDEP